MNDIDREKLVYMINTKSKIKEICSELGICRQTIRREILKNSVIRGAFNCYEKCPLLVNFPYCCNTCEAYKKCHYPKRNYLFSKASKLSGDRFSKAHSGTRLSEEEIQLLDKLLWDEVKEKGHSIHMFLVNHPEIKICEKTIYNLIDKNIFRIRNIDLRLKVKRKYKKKYYRTDSKKPEHLLNRTYEDFLDYIGKNPDLIPVEIDTVHGKRTDKKCLLTLTFRKIRFQMVFVLKECTSAQVLHTLRYIQYTIGYEEFDKMFPIILADNGPEFDDLWMFEFDREDGEQKRRVFYARPYRSGDKGLCENNHRLVRYLTEKGVSLDSLDFEDSKILTNNINGIPKKSISDFTPYELIILKFKKASMDKLGFKEMKPNDIILKTSVLTKKKAK